MKNLLFLLIFIISTTAKAVDNDTIITQYDNYWYLKEIKFSQSEIITKTGAKTYCYKNILTNELKFYELPYPTNEFVTKNIIYIPYTTLGFYLKSINGGQTYDTTFIENIIIGKPDGSKLLSQPIISYMKFIDKDVGFMYVKTDYLLNTTNYDIIIDNQMYNTIDGGITWNLSYVFNINNVRTTNINKQKYLYYWKKIKYTKNGNYIEISTNNKIDGKMITLNFGSTWNIYK